MDRPVKHQGARAPGSSFAVIDRLVARLPPFPLGAPLPDIRTGQYHPAPCGSPRARYFPSETCHCGFLMGEHQSPAMAQRLAAE